MDSTQAQLVQRSHLALLKETDFIPNVSRLESLLGNSIDEDSSQNSELILSSNQKDLLKSEMKNFVATAEDLKEHLFILNNKLKPVVEAYQNGTLPPSRTLSFMEIKYQLYLLYCSFLAFIILKKSRGESISDHPVLEQLIRVQLTIKKLKPMEKKMAGKMDSYSKLMELRQQTSKIQPDSNLEEDNNDSDSDEFSDVEAEADEQIGTLENSDMEEEDQELLAAELLAHSKSNVARKKRERETFAEYGPDGPRPFRLDDLEESIDDDRIAPKAQVKNKGDVKYRSKKTKNPRIHAKAKFQSAQRKQRSKVSKYRDTSKKYAGETTGIDKNIYRSRSFK